MKLDGVLESANRWFATAGRVRRYTIAGVILFVSISLLGHHKWGTQDAIQRFGLTRSLVHSGSVVTAEFGPIKYGPLQPILMVPTYVAGYGIGWLTSGRASAQQVGYRVSAFIFSPLCTVLLVLLFFQVSRRLGASARDAANAAFILLFGSLVLPYSRLLFTEPLNALLVLLAAAGVLSDPDDAVPWTSVFSITLLSLNNAIFVPLLLLVAVAAVWRSAVTRREICWNVVASSMVCIVFSGVGWGWYNWLRYGDIRLFGYQGEPFSNPVWTGLHGLLVSIGRGLLIYSPVSAVALGLCVWRIARKSLPPVLIVIFGVFVCYLVLYAHWCSFEGGWCWGPRFLLPFLPACHLVVAIPSGPRGWGRVLTFAGVAGVGVNAWEYLGVYQEWERLTFGDGALDYRLSVFSSQYAAILHNWDMGAAIRLWPQFGIAAILAYVGLQLVLGAESRPDAAEAPSR